MVISDLNVGILYTFGIVSLGVYGIVLAGYAANSKYPFLGGIRSSAQMISYEISMGMSVIPVLADRGQFEFEPDHRLAGAARLAGVVRAGFVRHFPRRRRSRKPTGCRSICRRRKQELVGGYHTEYSSMKFALFFLGEYSNMIASAGMMVTLFFGGWTLPFWGLDHPAATLACGPRAHLDFPGEDAVVHAAVHLGALDVPAFPV